jgi:nucleotide-binding universal stress UspA family protein
MTLPPAFEVVLHPTDLTPAAHGALEHALRLVLAVGGSLRILHVRDGGEHRQMPGVRGVLQGWGRISPGAGIDAVAALGIVVSKVEERGEPVPAIVADVERHAPDLIVMATHPRTPMTRIFRPSVAEPATRAAGVPTLLFGPSARPFVDTSGALNLRRILIPVEGDSPLALEGAARLARATREPMLFRMVHVGANAPALSGFVHPGWTWESATGTGGVVAGILEEARAWSADVVVMRTEGHDSAGDVLFGSTTEQVVRGAPCPVLVMPAGR